MRQESTRPKRGLSLYITILSVIAIESLAFMEFNHTALFFALWGVFFGFLTVWELARETKRSRKSEALPGESLLSSGDKPVTIIDLDQERTAEPESSDTETPIPSGDRLRDRISGLRGLEECFLVVAFAVLSILNLLMTIAVAAFGLVV